MNEYDMELSLWLGRKQACRMMAGRCSAALAISLRSIRDGEMYRSLGLTWNQFCSERAGIHPGLADRTIRHLEEFGPRYFALAEIIGIGSHHYRLIAHAMTDRGLRYGSEIISISGENAARLAAAAQALRAEAESSLPKAA